VVDYLWVILAEHDHVVSCTPDHICCKEVQGGRAKMLDKPVGTKGETKRALQSPEESIVSP